MKCSVVIPSRYEAHLTDTVRRIRETQNGHDAEIVVVLDGDHDIDESVPYIDRVIRQEQRGIHACRDTGIMEAEYDCIILLDAHMNFQNEDWITGLAGEYSTGMRDIFCGCSVGLCHTTYDIAFECEHCTKMRDDLQRMGAKAPGIRRPRYGVSIRKKEDATLSSGTREHRILYSKWNHDGPGQVGGVLGACYCMSRARYIEIGRPWQHMRQWGTSEQALSLINWCMGGSCEALPQRVGHLYRKPHEVPYAGDDRSGQLLRMSGIWFNRYWLAHVLPMSGALRDELLSWLDWNYVRSGITRNVQKWLAEREVRLYAMELRENCERTLDDYFSVWGEK